MENTNTYTLTRDQYLQINQAMNDILADANDSLHRHGTQQITNSSLRKLLAAQQLLLNLPILNQSLKEHAPSK